MIKNVLGVTAYPLERSLRQIMCTVDALVTTTVMPVLFRSKAVVSQRLNSRK
ncbi:hypothetical protein DFR76_101757 [Nocardia pseudobrasiliensis]|uniref:Uncharacterized protein n=1 Tax=Nocardia pseudobrasiliensis TaxID=45979 RepID=A0A370IES9_9NOCA|nr:hypothetical protein DFR76_101757 [Nocardia pseudobrasiliensis]